MLTVLLCCRVLEWMKSNDRLTTSTQHAQYSTDGGSDRSSSLRHSHKRSVRCCRLPHLCSAQHSQ